MALPPHNFQQHFEPQHPLSLHHHQQQSQPLRNFLTMDGQISPQVQYLDLNNFQDHSQHSPFVPTFHVAGFAPETFQVADGNDTGADLQWNNGFEVEKKRPEVLELLQNNSQMLSLDLSPPCTVSTGLKLSLYNSNNNAASSGDSSVLSVLGDGIDRELRRQDAEIDRFLKIQGEQLRRAILDKVQASNNQMLSYVEQKVLKKLSEKDAELQSCYKRNMDLQERIQQLSTEAVAWQKCAMVNENMMNTLKFNIQQAYAQNKDYIEGCGDSEEDDTATCCNGGGIDFQLLFKENSNMRELMTCKVCSVNRVCMLLLPCRHLCLCNDCESKLSHCPLCMSPKSTGMKVFI